MDSENSYGSCQMCGREHRHSGEYDLPVCDDCRNSLLARPFPKWILFFMILILGISVFSLVKLPSVLAYGIAYEKGQQLSQEHKHVSALQQFEKVAKIFPKSAEIQFRLYESYFENGRIDEAYATLDKLIAINEKPDGSFADKVNAITDKMDLYYTANEGFYQLSDQIKDMTLEEQLEKIETYIQTNQSDILAIYSLCDLYYEMERYTDIEALLEPKQESFPDWKLGLNTLIPVKRELGKYDEAKDYYETLIALNVEDPYAYISAVKVELKQKNDAKALELAQKALALSPDDSYIQGVMAMVYYYLGDEKQTKQYLEKFNAAKDVDQSTSEFINSIVSGQLVWR